MKRILHVTNNDSFGGAETIINKILREYNLPGFCLSKSNKNIFEGLEIYYGNEGTKYKFSIKILMNLIHILKKKEIEIIHVHLAWSLFYCIGAKFFVKNIKIIYHEHGEIQFNKFLPVFLRIFSGKIEKIIAVSNIIQEKIINLSKVKKDKVIVIYNFVDNNKIQVNTEERDKFIIKNNLGDSDVFYIGFVGRLNKIKGCDILIKAAANLMFPWKLLIAGDGEEKDSLIALSKEYKVEANCIFLGYINSPGILYSICNTIIVPSKNESFGLSIIESQSAKCPVIASDIEGINEIIKSGYNGLLFTQGDPNSLSNTINYLYSNVTERQNIIDNGIYSSKKYSKDYFFNGLQEVYSQI